MYFVEGLPVVSSRYYEAITPNDSTELKAGIKLLFIGGPGNLIITGWDDVTVTLPVVAGQQLMIDPKKVLLATTASNIVALR